MKYCAQCGTQNEDDKKFCVMCGKQFKTAESVIEDREKEQPKKKGKKVKKVKLVLSIAAVGVFVAGILFLSFYLSDQESLKREIKAEQWEDAKKHYESMLETGAEEDAAETLVNVAEQYQKQYVDKEMSFEEVQKKLREIKGISENVTEIVEIMDSIDALSVSRTAFDLAEKYWEEQDYENALMQYQLVIENDENYQTAQERFESGKQLYKEQIISEVEKKAEKAAYSDAVQILQKAGAIIGSDEELVSYLKKYELEDITNTLSEYEKTEDYASAISLLSQNKELYENNQGLKADYEKYVTEYRKQLFANAKEIYDSEGYASAIEILNKGLKIIPNDADVLAKIAAYKECAPVELQSLNVLSTESPRSLSNKYKGDSDEDLYGNVYHGYTDFGIGLNNDESVFVEYLCEGKYTNFKGRVYVPKIASEKCFLQFRIYADGVKIYESDFMNRKSKALDFDVDISQAEVLKVEVYNPEGYGQMYLVDAFVSETMSE